MKKINAAKLRSAIVRYVLLAIGTVVFTLPMLYMISTSLRPNGALYEYPPRFFPKPEALTLENYDYILHQSKFYLNFLKGTIKPLQIYKNVCAHRNFFHDLCAQTVVS